MTETTSTHDRRSARPMRSAAVLLAVAWSVGACSAIGLGGDGCPSSELDSPGLDIWYGDLQRVGHIGQPQTWFNVLGSVDEPDRAEALVARLNGGPPRDISIGPDDRRLAFSGDFNIDLRVAELRDGPNEVAVEFEECDGRVGERLVTVLREPGAAVTEAAVLDWTTAASIDELGQVVDGRWHLDDGLRTSEPAYDRLIAVGDVEWSDYDVTVPITVHAIDETGLGRETSGWGAGVGLITHWTGHGDRPVEGWQPATGWYPYGAIGWFWWHADDAARLRLDGNEATVIAEAEDDTPPPIGQTFFLRLRVESAPDGGSTYSLKSWPATGEEPEGWDLSGPGAAGGPTQGSLLLVAHHVDATFGPVSIDSIREGVG
jgi:hypothetical protein